jgi:predicted TIM-barrel fold metal-dependent hydrolase
MKNPSVTLTILLIIFSGFAKSQAQEIILLKNYRPISIYHTPQAKVTRAAFPVTDIHSHDYAQNAAEIDQWVKSMDEAGISHTIIQTYTTGKSFDSLVEKYKPYGARFELWCGFDYTGFGTEGWSKMAVAELERCYKKGARGVGELGDKGEGELYSKPTPGKGVHMDNPALRPLLDKCGELKMPVSIHIGEDQWMYDKPDSTNDGMMNAGIWHVNMDVAGKLNHAQLMAGLAKALEQHPKTIFVACHLANCCADLSKLGLLLDAHPNLYADIAARYSEISPVPRYTLAFFTKYQDRLLYGTDMGMDGPMYRTTFRILETADEHFYATEQFNYHWALYGINIPKEVLVKIYQGNAAKILNRK